jgi:hypothetical protein
MPAARNNEQRSTQQRYSGREPSDTAEQRLPTGGFLPAMPLFATNDLAGDTELCETVIEAVTSPAPFRDMACAVQECSAIG